MIGPGVDAARHVGDGGESLRSQVFGDAKAAATVMTVNQQMFLAGKSGRVFGDLAHGNVRRSFDLADQQFVRLSHIDELGIIFAGIQNGFGFGD